MKDFNRLDIFSMIGMGASVTGAVSAVIVGLFEILIASVVLAAVSVILKLLFQKD